MASNVETVDHDCAENVEELSLEEEAGFRKLEFATATSKTDIAFVSGDKKLYVSSVVIELFSPVFEKMICEKVKNEQGMKEIEITGCSAEDFDDFLTCFYPGKDYEISDSSVFRILPLAHRFGVKSVIKLCERQLLYMVHRMSTPPELLSECMSVAYSFNLEKVKQQSFEIYKTKQNDDFKELCIPLPNNHEARAAILEACLPEFILTENKYAFSQALVTKERGRHIDMADFDDARYGKLELYVNTENKYPNIKGNNRITLWGINLQLMGLWDSSLDIYRNYLLEVRIRFARGTKPSPDSMARMAVLYRIHNVSSAKEDIFIAKQVTITGENITKQTTVKIDPVMRKAILEQCTTDQMFFMTVHILMNKPDAKKK